MGLGTVLVFGKGTVLILCTGSHSSHRNLSRSSHAGSFPLCTELICLILKPHQQNTQEHKLWYGTNTLTKVYKQ